MVFEDLSPHTTSREHHPTAVVGGLQQDVWCLLDCAVLLLVRRQRLDVVVGVAQRTQGPAVLRQRQRLPKRRVLSRRSSGAGPSTPAWGPRAPPSTSRRVPARSLNVLVACMRTADSLRGRPESAVDHERRGSVVSGRPRESAKLAPSEHVGCSTGRDIHLLVPSVFSEALFQAGAENAILWVILITPRPESAKVGAQCPMRLRAEICLWLRTSASSSRAGGFDCHTINSTGRHLEKGRSELPAQAGASLGRLQPRCGGCSRKSSGGMPRPPNGSPNG